MKCCVIQFAKAPVINQVKTRLQPTFSPEQSLSLHRNMTRYIATRLSVGKEWDYQLAITRPHDFFSELVFDTSVTLVQQEGQGLGDRLRNASARYFDIECCDTRGDKSCESKSSGTEVGASHKALIFIGSDCPFLETEHLKEMFAYLTKKQIPGESVEEASVAEESIVEDHYDLVIIPATDGGYVALGVRAHVAEIYENIEWGSAEVFEQTLNQAKLAGLRVKALAALSDIDRPEDIALLPEAIALSGN